MKKAVRSLSSLFRSSLRLMTQERFRADASEASSQILDSALNLIMDKLGTLQHHDAITGTAMPKVADDYVARANKGIEEIHKINSKIIANLLFSAYGVKVTGTVDPGVRLAETPSAYGFSLGDKTSFLVAVINPEPLQERHEFVQIEVPWNDIKVEELTANQSHQALAFDHFKPKLLLNSHRTYIKSTASIPLSFNGTLTKLLKISKQGEAPLSNNFKQASPKQTISAGSISLEYQGRINDKLSKNMGAPVFQFKDQSKGTSQRFAVSLRFY